MTFKTWINDLRDVQSVINNISNTRVIIDGATGLLNTNSLKEMSSAVSGLSKEQALLVLSTKNLNAAQQEQVLLAAGIISSENSITASAISQALAKTQLSATEKEALLTKLGLIDATTGEAIANATCTKEELLKVLATKGIIGADADAIISSIGLTSANSAQAISFDLLTASIWANIKALGKWLITNPVGWAILGGTAIFGLVKAYDALTDSVEEVQERTDKLLDSYNSAISEANSNAKTIESLADRYGELSKGVNNLGENVSLTSDEYSEYKGIVDQIAEMFPTLITGYTDEGTAILSLKGNVEKLRDAYKEAQTEAYNLLIVSGEDTDGNDIISNYKNQVNGNESWLSKQSSYIDGEGGAKDAIDIITKLTGALTPDEFRDTYNELYEQYKNIWNSDKIQDALKSSGFEELSHAPKWGELTSDDLAKVKSTAQATIQTYKAEIDSQLKNVDTLANAYLMTDEDYSKLDEQSQTAASLIVNSITEDIANGFKTKEDVGAYVANIVSKIRDNPDLNKSLVDLFTEDFSSMSIDEAKSKLDGYINTIAKVLNEDPVELKVRLGFDDYNDDDIAPLKTKVQGFLKDEFDDKVGELSLDDLQVASKLEIPEGTLLSWDELKQKIEETKNAASDETDISTGISDTIDRLNTQLKPTFDALKDAYQNIFKSEDGKIKFSLDGVDISTFKSIKSAIDELNNIDGVSINYEDFDNFVKVLSDTSSTSQDVQAQFNQLATSIVYASDCTKMSQENFDLLCKSLYEMGLVNAPEVLNNIKNAQEELKASGIDLNNVTLEEAQAFLNEAQASEIAKNYLKEYLIQKQLASQPLNTSADVQALQNLCNSLGVTGEMLRWVTSLKSALGAVEAGAPIQAFQSQIDTANKNIEKLTSSGGSFDFKFNSNVTAPSSSSGSKGSGGSRGGSGKSGGGSKTKDTKQTIDWIERKLKALQGNLDKTQAKFENLFALKSPKNLSKSIKNVTKTLNNATKSTNKWKKALSKIKLSDKLKKQIQSGKKINLSKYSKATQKAIKKYQKDWKNYSNAQTKQSNAQKKLNELNGKKGKTNNIDTQLKQIKALEKGYGKAASTYKKYADKVKLSKSLKKKVQNGSYNINDYSSDMQKQIQKYQDYWDKYQEALSNKYEQKKVYRDKKKEKYQLYVDDAEAKIAKSQAYAELDAGNYKEQNKHLEYQKKQLKTQYDYLIKIAKLNKDSVEVSKLKAEYQKELNDLIMQEFDNIANTYDKQIGLNNNKIQAFQDQISLLEAKGQQIGSALYTKQMSLNNVNEKKLITEREKLIAKLEEIPKNTDDWYEAQDKLFAVDGELTQIQIENANLQKSINQLKFDRFDDLLAKLNDIVDETDFLIDMLDSDNFFDDNGKITDDGITAMGMYAQKYDVYLAEAQKYKEQMAELERDYQNDIVDPETYETKMREYKNGQQDMIRSANDAKKSIVSLVKEGLDAQNKALEEAIQKQKDLLSEQQKARNLNQTLEDQNKRIARLKKQLAVLDADDSESARKTKRELQSELDDLLKEQENTLYDQSIEDQEKNLDELLENSEKQASDYLKNSEAVFVDALNYVNANTETVSKNLEKISSDLGYDISTNITNAWKQSGNAVSDFGTTVSSTMPGVLSQISLVTEQMRQLAEESEKAAKSLVKDTVDDYTDHTNIGANGNNGNGSSSETKKDNITTILENGSNKNPTSELAKAVQSAFGKGLTKDEMYQISHILRLRYKKEDFYDDSSIRNKAKNAVLQELVNKGYLKKSKSGYIKGYAKGGIIDPHDILKRTGEDGFIIANQDEAVLTEPQWQSIRDLGTTLTNLNQQIYKPYIPEFQTRNVQSPVYNIDSSITVDGVATNEIVKDMADVAKKQAENVITEINRRTYAKGVRWK